MDWHSKTVMETLKLLETSYSRGLTLEEARKRLIENGKNEFEEKKKETVLKKFIYQFKDASVLMLIAAAAVSFAVSLYEGKGNYSEPLLIIAIIVFNAAVGVIQENKAEKALAALKAENPKKARVMRSGYVFEIPADEIVTGDILHISQGDIVPADCRICECMGLTVSEAGLTGESCPISKTVGEMRLETPLAERGNMLYMGSPVLSGSCMAAAVETGMDTELGKIAQMLDSGERQDTPLQKKLAKTGKMLGAAAVAVCAVIFFMGIIQRRPVLDMLMTSVSLAVAAIPEGLPATVTVMLAIGVQRMARENAVVRRLSAVEALGGASVICTDKTGTLTKNKMAVSRVYGDEKAVLKAAALCTSVDRGKDGWIGDPTETALVEAAGFNEDRSMPKTGEISFTSERKIMTCIFAQKGRYVAITKGAAEAVLEKCCYKDNEKTPLTSAERKKLYEICADYEKDGLRVLVVAARTLDEFSEDSKKVEKDLCFKGIVGLHDELRPEAAEAVRECGEAGIRVIMVTGDSPVTARTVAKAAGIESKRVVTGREADEADDAKLRMMLDECRIFARTSPAHKLRIVNMLKSMGHTAAMTGDACNDAPALKAADIGCAMGLNGTRTAVEAADIVLTDDNFATIVKAVKCGRCIYDNIKKAVHFLLSSNIGEIITVFTSMCCSFASPLAPVQLLWINLITDSMPAIALGLEKGEKDIMRRMPDTSGAVFDKTGWISIAAEGAVIGMLALLAGAVGNMGFGSPETGATMTFAVLSISQLVHSFNMKSEKTVLGKDILSNKWLIYAFFAGLLLQVGVIEIGALNELFAVTKLNAVQWLCVAAFSLVPLAVVEIEKRLSSYHL